MAPCLIILYIYIYKSGDGTTGNTGILIQFNIYIIDVNRLLNIVF